MILTIFAIITRILSNSLLNVFQKKLSALGQKVSIINFYTYAGLTIICLPLLLTKLPNFSFDLIFNVIIMGLFGALGNYFIIKALSIGELSILAPINSYKPIVAMIFGLLYLQEVPSISAIFAILLIILGSILLFEIKKSEFNYKAILYRILALIFSATEAIFIKKVIALTDVSSAFYLWCIFGFFGTTFFVTNKNKTDFKFINPWVLVLLILSVAIMQYSTNFVFSRMNVAYALAIFQTSTIVSIIFGANIFKEKNLTKKLVASSIMIAGAIILILC